MYWAANGPEVTGVGDAAVTVMHAGSGDGVCAVNPGVVVRKTHSTRRNAFQMVNGERISEITINEGLSHTPVSLIASEKFQPQQSMIRKSKLLN